MRARLFIPLPASYNPYRSTVYAVASAFADPHILVKVDLFVVRSAALTSPVATIWSISPSVYCGVDRLLVAGRKVSERFSLRGVVRNFMCEPVVGITDDAWHVVPSRMEALVSFSIPNGATGSSGCSK